MINLSLFRYICLLTSIIHSAISLQDGNIEAWTRNITLGSYATVILNRGTDGSPRNVTTTGAKLGFHTWIYMVVDVFEDKRVGQFDSDMEFSVLVNPSSAVLLYSYPCS